MTKKPFVVQHNLDSLSPEQRKAYLDSISEYVGLSPEQNWFDLIWIHDEENGFKKLVPYAKRGTTDVLREKHQISVLDMVDLSREGYVAFKAIGKNANGRQEVAIGSHSIEGLKGPKLASAVMTAETRAGRRLTLKFVGLGILDASEVDQETAPQNKAGEAALVGPAPITIPAPQTFSIVHELFHEDPPFSIAPGRQVHALSEPPRCLDCKKLLSEHILINSVLTCPLDNTSPLVTPSAAPQEAPGAQEAIPTAEHKRRGPRGPRGAKKTVSLAIEGDVQGVAAQNQGLDPVLPVPTQVKPAVPVQVFAAAAAAPAISPVNPATEAPSIPPPQVDQLTAATPPADFPGKPTKEQELEYRNQLRTYSTDTLIKGGMVPSQNIGGVTVKLRLFCEKMSGKPTQQMTVDDWTEFFEFMSSFVARNGEKGLVKYVNDCLGAK